MENNNSDNMNRGGEERREEPQVVYGRIRNQEKRQWIPVGKKGTGGEGGGPAPTGDPATGGRSRKKPKLISRGIAFLLCFLLFLGDLFIGRFSVDPGKDSNGYKKINYMKDYIAVLDVNGTMGYSSGSYFSENTYDQSFLLDSIDQLEKDRDNKALVLRINTPGGESYAIDELYQKILEYKKTGRPVYTYMESQACSGGYYVAAPSNRIYANRNAWTGSIGVTMGTFYDVSGLLDKLGIKTQTITSGPNKAMGSATSPMTDEQKAIFQSLIDDAYSQFVDVVAKGRHMTVDQVKALADGRVYTAEQAKSNGLIDEICTEKEFYNRIRRNSKLQDCDIQYIAQEQDKSFVQSLLGYFGAGGPSLVGQYRQAMELVNSGGSSFQVMYISQIRK